MWYENLSRTLFCFVTIYAQPNGQTDNFLLGRPRCMQWMHATVYMYNSNKAA